MTESRPFSHISSDADSREPRMDKPYRSDRWIETYTTSSLISPGSRRGAHLWRPPSEFSISSRTRGSADTSRECDRLETDFEMARVTRSLAAVVFPSFRFSNLLHPPGSPFDFSHPIAQPFSRHALNASQDHIRSFRMNPGSRFFFS